VRAYSAVTGLLAIVAAVVFMIQLTRWASFYFGASFGDTLQNAVSVGPYLALGGGALALVGAFVHKQ